jgi:putative ABC transport system substrate-binding protein
VRRRQFIALLGAAAATASVPARAQRAGRRKIGVLLSGLESDPDSVMRIAAFRRGLADLGWKEGDNIRVDTRWAAGQSELITQYARELVALAPDIILANSSPVLAAFQKIGTSIPVVFVLAIDPVGMRQVDSLAHPGGNFTGFTFIDPALVGKWTDLLKDVAPTTVRAGLLFNPATSPFYPGLVQRVEAGRQPGEIEVAALPVATTAEMEAAVGAFAQQPGGSLLIVPDPFIVVRIKPIAQLAALNRLPAISVYRPFVVEGGLMSYGPDTTDIFRRSAGYVDRILKGANPAELPVQQPDKFEFAINLRTAKALGLSVPPAVLATADEVIE